MFRLEITTPKRKGSKMSIRSDIAYALHSDVVEFLGDEFILEHFSDAAEKQIVDGHHLYVYRDCLGAHPSFAKLDQALVPFYEHVLKINVCHDYPTSENRDLGNWVDNPWNLRREVRAELCF
jgi:hypothetical protein